LVRKDLRHVYSVRTCSRFARRDLVATFGRGEKRNTFHKLM